MMMLLTEPKREMKTMQLQKLGTERMQEIIEFDHLCFPNDFWKEEDWESLLRDERAIYYALLDDGRIVGDLFLYNWQGEQDYVKLMHISVHPDYRKQGLGERLMTHAQQEMKELGMGRFRGETRASNLPMQRLFEKMGYRLDRVEENYYHNPEESAYKYLLQF